ncbi:MAG: hypothetical protein Crog4KO_35610 [Crocinitomicaceae bacterium]
MLNVLFLTYSSERNDMSPAKMQIYLSDALDQVACKKTLMEALQSRVSRLQNLGTSDRVIIERLEDLCDDPYQINDDVIIHVIESILLSRMAQPDPKCEVI